MDPKVDYRRLVEAKLTCARRGAGGDGCAALRPWPTRRNDRARNPAGRWLAAALAAALVAPVAPAVRTSRSRSRSRPLMPQIVAQPVWNQRIGDIEFPLCGGGRRRRLTRGRRATAPCWRSQAETGRELLARATWAPTLSAGVGSDGRFASVVTRGNEVVTLEAAASVWRKRGRRPASSRRRWWPASASS